MKDESGIIEIGMTRIESGQWRAYVYMADEDDSFSQVEDYDTVAQALGAMSSIVLTRMDVQPISFRQLSRELGWEDPQGDDLKEWLADFTRRAREEGARRRAEEDKKSPPAPSDE